MNSMTERVTFLIPQAFPQLLYFLWQLVKDVVNDSTGRSVFVWLLTQGLFSPISLVCRLLRSFTGLAQSIFAMQQA